MNRENDLRILTALYDGNHLSDEEIDRLQKIIFLLDLAQQGRIREEKLSK